MPPPRNVTCVPLVPADQPRHLGPEVIHKTQRGWWLLGQEQKVTAARRLLILWVSFLGFYTIVRPLRGLGARFGRSYEASPRALTGRGGRRGQRQKPSPANVSSTPDRPLTTSSLIRSSRLDMLVRYPTDFTRLNLSSSSWKVRAPREHIGVGTNHKGRPWVYLPFPTSR